MKWAALTVALALSVTGPVRGGPPRDVVRAIKGLASESGNEKVLQAVSTLEADGFVAKLDNEKSLDAVRTLEAQDFPAKMSELRSEQESDSPPPPEDAAPAAPSDAPAAPATADIGPERAKALACAGALPVIRKALPGAKTYSNYAKRSTRGRRPVYYVTVYPQLAGTLMFYCTYTVTVDAATGKILKVK